MLKLPWSPQSKTHAQHVISPRHLEPVELAAPRESNFDRVSAPIFAVLGSKGGAGATTVAINLAFALAKQRRFTALVDANLQQPDAATILGREPTHTLLDLVSRSDSLDQSMFDACCMTLDGTDGYCRLLSPPPDGEAGITLDLSKLAEFVNAMRSFSQTWVLDMPKHLDRHLVNLLDCASILVLVVDTTVAGVASAKRWLRVLNDLDYSPNRIVCVANRSGSQAKSVETELCSYFDGYSLYKLPNVFRLSQCCTVYGEPAVSRHPGSTYAREIDKLARALLQKSNLDVGDGHSLRPAG